MSGEWEAALRGKGRTYEVVYAAAGVVWGSSPCLSERQRTTGDGDT